MVRKRSGPPIVCRGQKVLLFIQNYTQMRQRLSFAREPAALLIVIPLSLKMTGKHQRGFVGLLREHGVTHVRLTGLALDFCVAFSAMDAADQGFSVTVIVKTCRAIDNENFLAQAI
jgi:hypothetical protein